MKVTPTEAFRLLKSNSSQGIFIVFEGINGCGKTTQIKRLNQYITAKVCHVTTTHEPGATPLGIDLRQILLEKSGSKYSIEPTAELLLFAADRHQHVCSVILPALVENQIVLCDRYYYSTAAFQGYGRGLQHSVINTLNEIATGSLEPTLVILLDLPVEEGLNRTKLRNMKLSDTSQDTFENEKVQFHQRVREGYLSISDSSKTPFLILNANQSADLVWDLMQPLADALA